MRGCRASQAPGVWDSLKTPASLLPVSQGYSECLLELSNIHGSLFPWDWTGSGYLPCRARSSTQEAGGWGVATPEGHSLPLTASHRVLPAFIR